jgi:predicted transposase YbfD/YdcC
VIAIDGKAVRGARDGTGRAPHLVAALAHGVGAVLGQVAVAARSNEVPAVRDLLKAFASLAGAVTTIGALHAQHGTAQVITSRGADYVMTVEVVYLITSDRGAGPAALAARVRGHWHIENKLHRVRDVTCQEDKSLARTGNAPRVMAVLRSLAISLPRLDGHHNIAAASRHHARDLQRTLKLLQTA